MSLGCFVLQTLIDNFGNLPHSEVAKLVMDSVHDSGKLFVISPVHMEVAFRDVGCYRCNGLRHAQSVVMSRLRSDGQRCPCGAFQLFEVLRA
jgi:hypothetical protein